MFKDIPYEKKHFYIFLIVHFLIWGLIGLIRKVLPADTLEGIFFGSLHDFGSPKHPPFAGWAAYAAYMPFKSDALMYFTAQLFITGGFIFVYKLARCFLQENQAVLSVLLLEGCWIYSYIGGYYGINPDTVLLFTLPAVSYYIYQSIYKNSLYYWIMLGIFTGISFLDKYQTGLLIIGAVLWAALFKRQVFKNKYFYASVLTAFIIFLPHIVWLFKNDFLPFLYFQGKLETINFAAHIIKPFSFLVMQAAQTAAAAAIFILCRIVHKSGFTVRKLDEKGCFLLFLTAAPLIIHTSAALITGSSVRPQWNYVFWFMTGIILFYFFPFKSDKASFKFTVKAAYAVMFIIFAVFASVLSLEKNYRSRYPAEKISNDLFKIWQDKTGAPLKYIGGDHELAYPVVIYSGKNLVYLMDTFGRKNKYIDEQDVKKSGALAIGRSTADLITYAPYSIPFITEKDVIPQEYKFKVSNAFKKEREYTIYYFIVPPEK